MKNYITSIMLLVLNVLGTYAQTVSVADVTINPGETKVVSISLNNSQTNIVSFQMDLTLPDGITINKDGCGLSNRFTDNEQELTIGKLPYGVYRLTSTSLSLKPISGTSGEIIKLSLTAANDAQGGTTYISNIRLATSNSEKLTGAYTIFRINVPYTLTYKVDGEVYKTSTIACGTALSPETAPTKEGHTFSGWSEVLTTMPNHDLIVTGSFNINSYALTYKVDGEVYKTSTVVYGATLTPEEEPTKEGYTFSGWSEIPKTMPAQNVTVTGSYTVNSYTLKYVVDGKVYKTSNVNYSTALTPETAPTKEGYTFSGWSEVPATMPANDVTVTGSFSINSYTLTYKVDGKVYKTSTVVYGTALTPEAALIKEGYTFSGWSEVPSTMPAKDVIITGSFSINSYTLTYKVDGKVYKTSSIAYGTSLTAEANPNKEGYTFSGWSAVPATMPANNVEVTGSFSINSYELLYKLDGAEYKKMTVVYGTTLTLEKNPLKEGYTFSGWSELPATMPAHNVEVVGTFSANTYLLFYVLDGAVYKAMSVKCGSTIVPEVITEKEGYTFSGWGELPETMPAHDLTIQGKYIIHSHTLTYKVDGKTYKTYTLDYHSIVTPEPTISQEGYTFSGWSEIPDVMPDNDVVVTGSLSINSYKLTYMLDGEEYKISTLNYGAMLTPEAAPSKEGYVFSGWSIIPEAMPAHDVNITGTFTKGAYKLSYMVDGEEYKVIAYDYEAAIVPETEPTKDGYTFSGWSEVPATMPAENVVVTGSFTINKYLLTYKVDNEVFKSDSIVYNSALTAIAEPTKEGYSFSGWSEIPETMPANDVVVTGSFMINKYLLTYKVDDEVYKSDSIIYNSALTAIAEPTKEGYTFSGWSEVPATMPAQDVVVTSSFTINKYLLTYIIDGEIFKSDSIEYNSSLTAIAEPTKEGCTFSGWSVIPETMPAHDVVVTGKFPANSYFLFYVLDGGIYKALSVKYGTPIIPEIMEEKEGYTFSGWSEIPDTMPAHDVTIQGKYIIHSHTLTYKVDEEIYKTCTLDYHTPINPEQAINKEGYTFSGWSEIPDTMPDYDVIVTGTFTINKYLLTYKVDDEVYKSDSIVYNSALTVVAEPTKEGYTFSGWSEMPDTMPANDVVVTGSFTINKYLLTYKVDNEVFKSDSIVYNSALTAIAEPTKEGYTFSGWSEIPETMPANDVVVTGLFMINKYLLTYKVDDEVYKSDSIIYNSALTAIAEPTKEGYTFSGWSEIPDTMPANDMIVTGYFAANKYQLTYKVDGMVYTCDSIEFNTTLIPEEEPTKEGYTFSGWSWIPKTMPSEDVTIIGSFIVNKYTVTFMYGEEVLKVDSVEYGAKIVLPESLNSNRYTLSGWLDVPETMPAHDIILYASYTDGISNVRVEKELKVYNEKGVMIPRMKKGLNIIRYNKGPVKKVFVK